MRNACGPGSWQGRIKPLAATLEVWSCIDCGKCSYGQRRGWSVTPCDKTATVHLTDAGGAPWCTEHGTKLFTSLLQGKRALGLDMELPPIMELLRTG